MKYSLALYCSLALMWMACIALTSCAIPNAKVTPMPDVNPTKTSNQQISKHIAASRAKMKDIQTSQKVESATLQTVLDDLNKLLKP